MDHSRSQERAQVVVQPFPVQFLGLRQEALERPGAAGLVMPAVVDDELAAALLEPAEVGRRDVHRDHRVLQLVKVPHRVEGLDAETRFAVHHGLQHFDRRVGRRPLEERHGTGDPELEVAAQFPAGIDPRHHDGARLVGDPGVHVAGCLDLARREAIGGGTVPALESVEFEQFDRAFAGIPDQTVGNAVEQVAGSPGVGLQQHHGLRGKGVAALVPGHLQRPCQQAMPVVDCRSPGDDAVVVVRIAQRLHQRRTPAVGAAPQVRVLHRPAVELLDDALGQHRGQVIRAEGEVELRVIVPVEGRVVLRFMAGVGRRHGEAVVEQAAGVPDHAGQASRGVEHEPPRPAFGRHADLEADRPVYRAPDPAVCRRVVRGGDQHARLHGMVRIGKGVEPGASVRWGIGSECQSRKGKEHGGRQDEKAHTSLLGGAGEEGRGRCIANRLQVQGQLDPVIGSWLIRTSARVATRSASPRSGTRSAATRCLRS